uniref:Uncharacterized protein n=1 Tax=Anopheles atroparvus TaxID=41427 RepID=A0A182JB30_ANOAO
MLPINATGHTAMPCYGAATATALQTVAKHTCIIVTHVVLHCTERDTWRHRAPSHHHGWNDPTANGTATFHRCRAHVRTARYQKLLFQYRLRAATATHQLLLLQLGLDIATLLPAPATAPPADGYGGGGGGGTAELAAGAKKLPLDDFVATVVAAPAAVGATVAPVSPRVFSRRWITLAWVMLSNGYSQASTTFGTWAGTLPSIGQMVLGDLNTPVATLLAPLTPTSIGRGPLLHGQNAERPQGIVALRREPSQPHGRLLRNRQRNAHTIPWFHLKKKTRTGDQSISLKR